MPRFARLLATALLLIATLASPPQAAADAAPDLLLILDASGSMWGQIDGENKIVIARRVVKDLLGELPDDAEIGLVAYGHRREGDCEDVETVVPLGPLDRAALGGTIEALNPKGKTPITAAVRQAVEVVRGRDGAVTVVLVSDGLETCGGDPCAAVREARAAGVDFLMHVVGFDVGEEDVSQLECAAQAGGGLYLDAEDAAGLGAALDQAVAAPAEVPAGRLSVQAVADGELADVTVRVTRAGSGEEVAVGRTYTHPGTNPRLLPLPDGTYDVVVKAVTIEGSQPRRFEGVVIADGGTVEKTVDFSAGELAVGVTRNGELSDATVRVYAAGTRQEAAASRTYTRERTNPTVFRLAAGTYDVEIASVEITDRPRHRFEAIVVEGRGRAERAHAFASGTLRVGAASDAGLVDATVQVISVASGKEVGRGRTYVGEKTNPRTFELSPGQYKVMLKAVKLEGSPKRELEVTIEAGGSVERSADF